MSDNFKGLVAQLRDEGHSLNASRAIAKERLNDPNRQVRPVVVVTDSLTMKDLNGYFKSKEGGGHNRRHAQWLSREVLEDSTLSAKLLPSGWHEILHPKNKLLIHQVVAAGLPSLGKP